MARESALLPLTHYSRALGESLSFFCLLLPSPITLALGSIQFSAHPPTHNRGSFPHAPLVFPLGF